MIEGAYPILTCEEAAEFERALLGGEEKRTWEAMRKVGYGLGQAIRRDFMELGEFPQAPKILLLIGKGHNSGDAFLGAGEIFEKFPESKIDVLYCLGDEGLRPLTVRARNAIGDFNQIQIDEALNKAYDICIDGILGMSFKPPVGADLTKIISSLNKHTKIRFRASVDVPSGNMFRADFTYATGIPKTPLFDLEVEEKVGRIRFIDIGFFDDGYRGRHKSKGYFLGEHVLDPLKQFRKSGTDKRTYGHLLIISGSKNYPGALIMSVKAALKSGVGLLTVLAPASLVGQCATEIPEAMWVPCPETEEGTLALAGKPLFFEQVSKANAVLAGPGLGDNAETLQLIKELIAETSLPFVLDANALVEGTFEGIAQRAKNLGAVIATPHTGEYKRIAQDKGLLEWNKETGVTTLLKGPCSKIAHDGVVYYSTGGGPIQARGGSGDILSGLIGSLLAQTPIDPLGALAKAVVWDGLAADAQARERGAVTSRTTDILEYLEPVLRGKE